MLNIVRHQIEVRCMAVAIPPLIEVDLAGAEIGDSIHISAVTLPDGVAPTITDRDFTIVTVAAPTIHIETVAGEGEEGEESEMVESAESEEATAEAGAEEGGEE